MNNEVETEKPKDSMMEKIASLCKRRGFIYPASEIYGGFANAFDYGPLGAQMKKNIKDEWWKRFVSQRADIVGLDSAIIQNPKVWEASGHLSSFSDPLVECKKCHQRFRADHIQEARDRMGGMANDWLTASKEDKAMFNCPLGGMHEFTEAKDFNLMFKTFIGVTEDSVSTAYLRPETAQGIFINFQNVLQSSRVKLPFGIAQIGKAFRNEITPGNFIFRTREFEQAEVEFFVGPDKEESDKWYRAWIEAIEGFYTDLGIKKENLHTREHAKDELSHYSSGTSDIEYDFPFGTSELAGIAQRTDYDLKQHTEHSGADLRYFDEEKGEKFIPYVVEPSMGVDRAMLAFMVDAYDESDGTDGRASGEITLRLSPKLAPIKVGVFPLIKKEGLPEIAQKIFTDLRQNGVDAFYDESGSVGRRYRRQDEIGTPWCITVDFDTLQDKTVTLRDRDTMEQARIKIEDLGALIKGKLS
ncbi:MAG: glycine--tRNA ligase [Patescibacteria group bacterium]